VLVTWRANLAGPTLEGCRCSISLAHAILGTYAAASFTYRRNLNLKPEVQTSTSHLSFKRSVPGAFNMGLIGSTCTALP